MRLMPIYALTKLFPDFQTNVTPFGNLIEEPHCNQRGFFVGMEYVNRIVRLDPAINSGDCGEHPFTISAVDLKETE